MAFARIALAAAAEADRLAAQAFLAAQGASVVAQCADLAALAQAVSRANPDLALVDGRLCPGPGEIEEQARRLGVTVLPLDGLWPDSRPGLPPGAGGPESPALHFAEARFDSLFEYAPIGMLVLGRDGGIRTANPAFCRMAGRDAQTICAQDFAAMVHPDDHPALAEALSRLDQGEPVAVCAALRLIAAGDESQVRRLTLAPLRHPSGDLVLRLAMIEDPATRASSGDRPAVAESGPRDALVREVHHRIKNNLQAVVGLLRRQMAAHPGLAEPLETAIGQVNTIAIVHGLQGRDPTEHPRLKDLLAGIAVAAENVVGRTLVLPPLAKLGGLAIDADETVPIAMVLNELLLNALKHSSGGDDTLPAEVMIDRRDDGVVLAIINSFDDPGGPLASLRSGSGNGLKLVQALLPTRGASLSWYRRAPGRIVTELVLSPPVLRLDSSQNTKKGNET